MARLSLSRAFLIASLSVPSILAFALPEIPPATSTYAPANWSPKPTSAPMRKELELFKRQNSFSVGADGFNTTVVPNFVCGYIGKQWSLGATCSASSSCFWDQNSQIVGCCTTEGPCTSGIYTSCYDGSGVKGKDSPFVYTCAGSSSCYVNTYIGTSRSVYRQYGCGNKNQSTTIYQTFADMPDTVVLPIFYTTFNYGGGAVVTSSSAAPTASTTTTPTAIPVSTEKKTNTGAIAGGVVGGLAGFAFFGTLVLFCLRRFRQSKTPIYEPEPISSYPQNMAEKLPQSPYYQQHAYANSQGGTTLVSSPRSPQPSDYMGSVHGGYNDSPRSNHIGAYGDPTTGGHHMSAGSEVGSDYGNQYRTFSPAADGYGMHTMQLPQMPQRVQEIGGRSVEAPRYEMEHPESDIVRKPVGSPRPHAR